LTMSVLKIVTVRSLRVRVQGFDTGTK
jgi:hypothetical protein